MPGYSQAPSRLGDEFAISVCLICVCSLLILYIVFMLCYVVLCVLLVGGEFAILAITSYHHDVYHLCY